jgi:hypothetical protein
MVIDVLLELMATPTNALRRPKILRLVSLIVSLVFVEGVNELGSDADLLAFIETYNTGRGLPGTPRGHSKAARSQFPVEAAAS